MSKVVPTLRGRVIAEYVSTSAGVHRPLTDAGAAAFATATSHYLREWLPEGSGRRWLDLGCGQGGLLRFARGRGFEVLGVDQSEEMLAACRAEHLNVVQGDVLQVARAQPEAAWDVISAFDLVEHLQKEQGFELLEQVHRALKPDGICLLKLPNAESPWGHWVTASDLTHEASYSALSLEQLAKLAGFKQCAFREVGPTGKTAKSLVRSVLWAGIRQVYRAANLIETGSAGSGIYTRVMIARLTKA